MTAHTAPDEITYLFGGTSPWDSSLWTAQDDRVRGGSSTSALSVPTPERACFHGHLDTQTLGGAGFASQRTLGDLRLDLSAHAGLALALGPGDGRKYTLTLKDALPGKRPDGRDESGLSWEVDFVGTPEGGDVLVRWDDFRATYRGRDKEDAEPLNLKDIKRVSLMMRSFFGNQEGDFSLEVRSISARKTIPKQDAAPADESDDEEDLGKPVPGQLPSRDAQTSRPWWRALLCGLI